MILLGCTRGHIRARYVRQGYLIRNLMFGHRWTFFGAISGPPPPILHHKTLQVVLVRLIHFFQSFTIQTKL